MTARKRSVIPAWLQWVMFGVRVVLVLLAFARIFLG